MTMEAQASISRTLLPGLFRYESGGHLLESITTTYSICLWASLHDEEFAGRPLN